MIDDEAAFFATEYSKDHAVANVICLDLVDQVLFIVQPYISILESYKNVTGRGRSVDAHLRYPAYFRRHCNTEALLSFQIVRLDYIVHSSDYDLFIEAHHANRFGLNGNHLVRDGTVQEQVITMPTGLDSMAITCSCTVPSRTW